MLKMYLHLLLTLALLFHSSVQELSHLCPMLCKRLLFPQSSHFAETLNKVVTVNTAMHIFCDKPYTGAFKSIPNGLQVLSVLKSHGHSLGVLLLMQGLFSSLIG